MRANQSKGRWGCGHKGKGRYCHRCEQAKAIKVPLVSDADRAALRRLSEAEEEARRCSAELARHAFAPEYDGIYLRAERARDAAWKTLADIQKKLDKTKIDAARTALELEAERARLLRNGGV